MVCGSRAGTPRSLLPAQPSVARQGPHPSHSVRTAALRLTAIGLVAQLSALSRFRPFVQALTSPGADMEPSQEGLLELAGCEGGSEEVRVGGRRNEQNGGVSLAQTPRMLDRTAFWKNLISLELLLPFSLLLYMYLLDHMRVGTFY